MNKLAVFLLGMCVGFSSVNAQEWIMMPEMDNPYFGLYNEISGFEFVALYEDVSVLEQKYNAAREREQSLANRTLGAAAMGVGGIGGMMLASGLAEKNVDENAEIDMRAYLATFRCDYGAGRNIHGGETDVQLPGTAELIPLYAEYVALANDLKKRKEQLELKPGIESESILDSATMGLYDDVSVGTSSGVYTSLSRALQNSDGEDAQRWAAQAEENAKKVKNGATVGGAGIAGGAIGNLILNQDKD